MNKTNNCKKSEFFREIDLSKLPIWTEGAYKGKINWSESIGHKIRFKYEDIEGEMEVVGREEGYLIVNYENKENLKIVNSSFYNGKLGVLLGKITNEFKVEIGDTFKDDKRDLIITDRRIVKKERIDKKGRKSVANLKFYKYKCNRCGFECGEHYKNGEYKKELWIPEGNLLNREYGCSCCCKPQKIVVEGINDIPTTAPWMVKYFQNPEETKSYTKTSEKKIYPICPDCGRVKDKKMRICDIYNKKSIGCACGDGISYPNKFMFNVLEQLKTKFKMEYSPEWIKPKRYDFYFELNNEQYIIEMDGKLGHGKSVHPKSKKTSKETKTDDEYKDKAAKEHGIEVIRIDCCESDMEYIKNNMLLDSRLQELFDLSNINWNKVDEFALSNRVKEACELKRDNPDMTTKDIGYIMELDRHTIVRYLKKGTKLGWCEYDPKEESLKGNRKAGKMVGKQVEIFKDGVLLGIFDSCADLDRQSEKLFGIKLDFRGISEVCLGNKKSYKGYQFKYVI